MTSMLILLKTRGKSASSTSLGPKYLYPNPKITFRLKDSSPTSLSCDETGLFENKMPNRTFITQEEEALLGNKPMKDSLNLLLCGNAIGDCKVKHLLMYHSETPRVFSSFMFILYLFAIAHSNKHYIYSLSYVSLWFLACILECLKRINWFYSVSYGNNCLDFRQFWIPPIDLKGLSTNT
ncbi:hypothetical protein AVEN_127926-1 [Araneus ventricosus]|uniref:Uncharacterized protein n=1 Tax=Araneus ventricosus TaxID=182803 RepID=A0A4Y1ZZY9_ARAVE|nr:hypothetical protein AVEN_127926-1 [Araneus ventricosus]